MKIQSWTIREEIGGYLPFVTYIWHGGIQPDEIPQRDEDGNIITGENNLPVMVENPEAGQEWCFAYGEREWMDASVFNTVREQTERHIYRRSRDGDINAEVGCP